MPIHICNRRCRRSGCGVSIGERAAPVHANPADQPVATFYFDQSVTGTAPCFTPTRRECDEMQAAGSGRFINRGTAFRLNQRQPANFRYTCSKSTDSDAGISVAEMEANVGITKGLPEDPPLRHVIERAQEKIKAIGEHSEGSFDTRAPLAFRAAAAPKAPAPKSALRAYRRRLFGKKSFNRPGQAATRIAVPCEV